jgi:5-hydroxyisourate hydrolase-like protein (transthyretin family)
MDHEDHEDHEGITKLISDDARLLNDKTVISRLVFLIEIVAPRCYGQPAQSVILITIRFVQRRCVCYTRCFGVPVFGLAENGLTVCLCGVASPRRTTEMPVPLGAAVSGRVVDSRTGQPIPGYDPITGYAQVFVNLYSCIPAGCFVFISSQIAGEDGRFLFENNLVPGSYRVDISVTRYQPYQTGIFPLAENERKDLGDLPQTFVPLIGSISGRLVNARTGAPVYSPIYPFASVSLWHCGSGWCMEPVATTWPDPDGRFRFTTDFSGARLATGTYSVTVQAPLYESYASAPFDVGENEDKDLGVLALTPLPTIGSISGQLVDSVTGEPLAGGIEPFAWVQLNYCDPDYPYCNWVTSQAADEAGRFRFERTHHGTPLRAGTYELYVSTNQYYSLTSPRYTIGENENRDLGQVGVQPYPLRTSQITPCNSVPSNGGICRYSLRFTSGMTRTLDGAAWSMVRAWANGAFAQSDFQAGVPQRLRLAPGRARWCSSRCVCRRGCQRERISALKRTPVMTPRCYCLRLRRSVFCSV